MSLSEHARAHTHIPHAHTREDVMPTLVRLATMGVREQTLDQAVRLGTDILGLLVGTWRGAYFAVDIENDGVVLFSGNNYGNDWNIIQGEDGVIKQGTQGWTIDPAVSTSNVLVWTKGNLSREWKRDKPVQDYQHSWYDSVDGIDQWDLIANGAEYIRREVPLSIGNYDPGTTMLMSGTIIQAEEATQPHDTKKRHLLWKLIDGDNAAYPIALEHVLLDGFYECSTQAFSSVPLSGLPIPGADEAMLFDLHTGLCVHVCERVLECVVCSMIPC